MGLWLRDDRNTGAGVYAVGGEDRTWIILLWGTGFEGEAPEETPEETPEEIPEETAPAAETPSQPAELTWDDVPVYPGASQTANMGWGSFGAQEGQCDRLEWRYYEVNASADEVMSFYEDEMPGYGWESYGHFQMGDQTGMASWSMWTKENGVHAAYVYVMESDGETILIMWRGVNCELY